MRHSSPRRTANKKRTAKMTVRSTLILASGMAKPNGPVHNVSDLACRSRHHSDPLAGLLTPFRCRVLRLLPGAPSVFSVVSRQYNTEKPELQGDSRPSRFSPVEWLSIHRRLFEGVFSHAGQIRQYSITKKEWVLNGDTVTYADWSSIKDTLDYDFATEKQFSYEGLSVDAAVKHLAKFSSDIMLRQSPICRTLPLIHFCVCSRCRTARHQGISFSSSPWAEDFPR